MTRAQKLTLPSTELEHVPRSGASEQVGCVAAGVAGFVSVRLWPCPKGGCPTLVLVSAPAGAPAG